MRRFLISLVVLVMVIAMVPAIAVADEPFFTKTVGFATKIGYRGIFAWEAVQPVDGAVFYGTDPDNLTEVTRAIPGAADTAQMAIAEGLQIGATYYWRVEDLLTGELSAIQSFKASNAYNDWNGSTYTLDLLVQLDTESLPPGVRADLALENIAQGINIFGERLYDAMDGLARLGNVLVTDTELDFGGNIPFLPPGCFTGLTNAADVLVQTTVPFDSHTFGGWSIEDPCISFYVGRLGQLVVPWGFGGSAEDLHFGYVATHEMMHYAFNAPDLYNPDDINDPRVAGCWNLDWDGSLMHNSGGWTGTQWELTELDRNLALTPCDHQHANNYTWDTLRERYTNVPLRPAGPIEHIIDTQARGNEDGGALDIQILNRTPAGSTLEGFTANDLGLRTDRCTEPGFTVLTDSSFDSTDAVAEHDVEWAAVAEPFDLGAGKIVFFMKVNSLANPPPNTTWPIVFRDPAGTDRFVRMSTNAAGQVSFAYGNTAGTNQNPSPISAPGTPALPESSFTSDGLIRIVLDRSSLGISPGQSLTQFITRVRVELPSGGAVTPDNMPDDLTRTGIYAAVGSENCMTAPPVAVDDLAETLEDTSVDIPVLSNDFDPSGLPLTIASVSSPVNGTAAIVGGSVRYTPNPNYNGTDSFSYEASNGAATDSASVSVTIIPTPDAPAAFDDRVTISAGTSFRIPVLANDSDPDGDALTITSATDPAKGSTQANADGTVRYTPDAGTSGTDSFNYTISDGALTDDARVIVQVIDENAQNPCALPGVTVVTDPANDQVPGSDGSYDVRQAWAGGLFPDGQLVFTMKVTGPLNPPPASSVWRIRFTAPNGNIYYVSMETASLLEGSAPVFRYGSISGSLISDLGAADSGAFTTEGFIAIGIRSNKVGLAAPGSALTTFSAQTQRFVGAEGSGGFFQMDGSTGGTYTIAACLQEPPNDPPSAIDDLVTTDEDSSVSIAVLANDTDRNGDAITITQFGQGSNGSVTRSGNLLVYSPNENFNGTDSFTYTISDGNTTASAVVHMTVAAVNDSPVAFDDQVTTAEDTAVEITVAANDSDIDSDSLAASAVAAPVNGTAIVNPNGTITYTPNTNYNGADMFTYEVSDGNGGSASATVFVTITPVNDAPVAVGDSANCIRNKSVTIAVIANDSDVEGPLQLTGVSKATHGTVRINMDQSITYTPKKSFLGSDSFTYTIADTEGVTASAAVSIDVIRPKDERSSSASSSVGILGWLIEALEYLNVL